MALWIALATLASPAEAVEPERSPRSPSVVLISMDGTRPADLTAERLPTLVRLGREGARARRMIPCSPSNTFPSHVTMATGVAPERHGLVDNRFLDPERGLFDRKDIPSWIEVEPIWSIAARQGIVSAAYYWVGSEGVWPKSGHGPTYWKPFSSRTSEKKKVDQILDWLDIEDPGKRPRLITSWFHGADHAAHDHGPDSEEVSQALRSQERALARLVRELDARGLFDSVTLIVVSDHGMVLAPERVDLGTRLSNAGIPAHVIGIGGFVTVWIDVGRVPDPAARAREAERVVEVARAAGLSAWRRAEAPRALGVDHVRFGDVVVRAPLGTAVVHKGLVLEGFHGYDPALPEMGSILVAYGRGVVAGTDLGEPRSVQVAPTVLRLLGLTVPEWMEGAPIAGLVANLTGSANIPAAP